MGFSENSSQGPPLFQEEELRSQPNMGQQEIGGRTPLAARMRPRSLEEFLGQHKIVGEQGPLRQAILRDDIPSVLFWGHRAVENPPWRRLLHVQRSLILRAIAPSR